MQTKLTLRLEEALIRKGKTFSKRSGESVSVVVAGYFEKLDVPTTEGIQAITPKVASLKGILKKTVVEEGGYYNQLEEKCL